MKFMFHNPTIQQKISKESQFENNPYFQIAISNSELFDKLLNPDFLNPLLHLLVKNDEENIENKKI